MYLGTVASPIKIAHNAIEKGSARFFIDDDQHNIAGYFPEQPDNRVHLCGKRTY